MSLLSRGRCSLLHLQRSAARLTSGSPNSWLLANRLISGRPAEENDAAHSAASATPAISSSLWAETLPGRKVVFQSDFTLGAQFAGLAVARALGIYAARGLQVNILPPCPRRPGDEVLEVQKLQQDMGSSGLAVGSTEQNVLAFAQAHAGAGVRAVSAMLQRTPLALGALPGTKLDSLSDLVGKKIGMARDELPLLKGMAAAAGVKGLDIVEVTHEDKQQLLLAGKVHAIQIYDSTEVLDLQDKLAGRAPAVLPIGQQPYDRGYAQVLFASNAALGDDALRATLRTFLQATYEGWERAAADTYAAAEAVAAMTGELPTPGVLAYHQGVLARLLPYMEPEAKAGGLASSFKLGSIDPSRWTSALDVYSKAGLVPARLASCLADTADLSLWPGARFFPAPGGGGKAACTAVDGMEVAAQIRAEAAASAALLSSRYGRKPALAVVRFGEQAAIEEFRRREVAAKQATSWYCMDVAGAAVGVDVHIERLPGGVSEADAVAAIRKLNRHDVDGIMVEVPLPHGIRYDALLSAVDACRRVDAIDQDDALSGTVPLSPTACMELFDRAGVAVAGRRVAVVGFGRLVGAPLLRVLLRRGATVSACHVGTSPEQLLELCRGADVIVACAGAPGVVTKAHVRPGAVVVNVGAAFDDARGMLLPDVAADVAEHAALLVGCPGGIGPIPVAVLLRSVATNAHRRCLFAAEFHGAAGSDAAVLDDASIRAKLPAGWQLGVRRNGKAYTCPDDGRKLAAAGDAACLRKTFAAPNFGAAVGLAGALAAAAERCAHHPDLSLTDFKHLTVELSSVSAGGVTAKDLRMAALVDELARQYS